MFKNKNENGSAKKINHKAYTLIELLIVMAITVMLFAVGIGGMITGQKQFMFQSNAERIIQLVRDARSLAIAGKAYPDYTDYDRDGNSTNLITPAHIGVNFDAENGIVTMFADLHKSGTDPAQKEGIYDAPNPFDFYTYSRGKDVAIEQFQINPTLRLLISGGPKTIFFSPIFADVTFDPPLNNASKFFIFGIKEKTGTRKKCVKIHPISGVPEDAVNECPTE
jgi:prepilin-type N-terminal cleavage/methylation domain-containing protein